MKRGDFCSRRKLWLRENCWSLRISYRERKRLGIGIGILPRRNNLRKVLMSSLLSYVRKYSSWSVRSLGMRLMRKCLNSLCTRKSNSLRKIELTGGEEFWRRKRSPNSCKSKHSRSNSNTKRRKALLIMNTPIWSIRCKRRVVS